MTAENLPPEGEMGTSPGTYEELARMTGAGFEVQEPETESLVEDVTNETTFQAVLGHIQEGRSKNWQALASAGMTVSIEASQLTGLSGHLPHLLQDAVMPTMLAIGGNALRDNKAARRHYRKAEEAAAFSADKANWDLTDGAEEEADAEEEQKLFGRISDKLKKARDQARISMLGGITTGLAAVSAAGTELLNHPNLAGSILIGAAVTAAGSGLSGLGARHYRTGARNLAQEGISTYESFAEEDDTSTPEQEGTT